MVIELCRHGVRAPENKMPRNLTGSYWPRGYAMLTELGQQQQFELGQKMRANYIEKHKILDETLNKN